MKVKDVKHAEGQDSYSIAECWNNRWYFFNKDGEELWFSHFDENILEELLEMDVLEVAQSTYIGYGVGFPVTHIKLDTDAERTIWPIKFGEVDRRE